MEVLKYNQSLGVSSSSGAGVVTKPTEANEQQIQLMREIAKKGQDFP
jgi:hypothetical protein